MARWTARTMGRKGAAMRQERLTADQRSAIARKAAKARWRKSKARKPKHDLTIEPEDSA